MMKHLKPYKLFESQDIVMAGLENAMRNRNVELFKNIIEQYEDIIDFDSLVDDIVFDAKLLSFSYHIPQQYLDRIEEFIILPISKIKSLKGIENFKNIKYLDCPYNKITSLKYIQK